MLNKLKDTVRHKFTKNHYNKRDWATYNKSLVNRGSITIWFTEEALKQWHEPSEIKVSVVLNGNFLIMLCNWLRVMALGFCDFGVDDCDF